MAKLARSSRKHTRRRSNGKTTSGQRKYNRAIVPKPLQKSIAREANQLGLSVDEYLRMAIAISKSFRDTVKTDKSFDMKSVAKMVNSPIWPILMQTIGPIVTGMLENPSTGNSGTAEERPSVAGQLPKVSRPFPDQQSPGQQPSVQPWPGQQVPSQQVPGQQSPGQQPSVQPWPGQQVPGQQVPGQQPSVQPWPGPPSSIPYEYW